MPYGHSGVNLRERADGYAGETTSLGAFFNAVYAWMAVGLGVTGLVAYFVSQSDAMMSMLYSSRGVTIAMALGAFALAWYVQSQFQRLSAGVATGLFLLYAVLIGAMISAIFAIYPIATLGAAFLMTGGTFAAMSVYGFVTKRDLSGIGSILVMAAIGLFFASIVNVFFANDTLSWIITYAVLAVFIGITAYQTQMLKHMAIEFQHNGVMLSRLSIVGSLVLYIAFINMFLSILRIIGDRR